LGRCAKRRWGWFWGWRQQGDSSRPPIGGLVEAAHAQNVRELANLRFGTVAACGAPGGVVIETQTGNRNTTGCVTALGGSFSAGRFLVRSRGWRARQVVLSISSATVTLTNGAGATLLVNDFNLVTNAGGPTETITVQFFKVFNVGARLDVKALQPTGTYSGSYTITANYL